MKYNKNSNICYNLILFRNMVYPNLQIFNHSYIIQDTTYMRVGSLYPSENNTPAYAQIYLYNPTNDDD